MPVNLQLGTVNAQGAQTRRPSPSAGDGSLILGESFTDAAKVLEQFEKTEDDLVGLNLSLRYGQDLDSIIEAGLAAEPNVKKHRGIIADTTREVTQAYSNAARESGVPKGFATHAYNQATTIQNRHLRDTSVKLGTLGLSTIQKSEALISSSMIDETTGRIPTIPVDVTEPGRGLETGINNKVIRLVDEGTIAAKMKSHFDIILKQEAILPATTNVNKEILDYSNRVLESVLESVAQNHADLFTSPRFKGARVAIEVPVLKEDGSVEMKTLQPNQAQLSKMIDLAEIQAAKNASLRDKQEAKDKEVIVEHDARSMGRVLQVANDPTGTAESMMRLYQHLAGLTSSFRPDYITDELGEKLHSSIAIKFSTSVNGIAQQREALKIVADRIKTGGPPKGDSKETLREIRRKLFDHEKITQDDLSKAQDTLTDATYNAVWDKALSQKDAAQSDLDKRRQEARVSIRRLLGNMPGSTFQKQVGVVSDMAEEDFMARMDQLQEVKGDLLTIEDIGDARLDALNGIIKFIATSSMNAKTVLAISRYQDIVGKDGHVISVVDQIESAWRDKTNKTITTYREYKNALFYANIRRHVDEKKEAVSGSGNFGETDRMRKLRELQEVEDFKAQQKAKP